MGIAKSSDAGKGKQGQGKRGEAHGLVCHVLGTGQEFHVPLGPSQGAECLSSCRLQAWWGSPGSSFLSCPWKASSYFQGAFPPGLLLFPLSSSPTTKHSSNQRSLACGEPLIRRSLLALCKSPYQQLVNHVCKETLCFLVDFMRLGCLCVLRVGSGLAMNRTRVGGAEEGTWRKH